MSRCSVLATLICCSRKFFSRMFSISARWRWSNCREAMPSHMENAQSSDDVTKSAELGSSLRGGFGALCRLRA